MAVISKKSYTIPTSVGNVTITQKTYSGYTFEEYFKDRITDRATNEILRIRSEKANVDLSQEQADLKKILVKNIKSRGVS